MVKMNTKHIFKAGIVSVALFVLAGNSSSAELTVAGIFSDGMVLQRGMDVPVWGTADPDAAVQVAFAGQTKQTTTNRAGKWMLKLDPLKASAEGRSMTISSQVSDSMLQVSNVLVGEVWLCGGQSNMDWTLTQLTRQTGSDEFKPVYEYLVNEIKTANDPLLRQFTVNGVATPGKEVGLIKSGGWAPAVKGKVNGFSGAGYFFGRELRKELGVPVGLIDANRGGTKIEPWIPREQYLKNDALKAFYYNELAKWEESELPAVKRAADAAYQKQLDVWKKRADAAKATGQKAPRKPRKKGYDQNGVPAALYNGFVHALVPYAIKGAVWYQGESNAGYRTEHYRESMLALIKGWREQWGQGSFPFIWCQLASFRVANEAPMDQDDWVEIQNQQREALALADDTGMAVLNDIGEARNIHPKNKVDVGKRLSLWALSLAYEGDIVCSGPLYQSSLIDGRKVILKFDHAGSGLMVGRKHLLDSTVEVQGALKRFQICGKDGQWNWADAKITGKDTVEVWHKDIPTPVEVRYAWSSNPEGANLYNKEGLPASLFKTGE